MEPSFDAVYYEPAALQYELGNALKQKYAALPWYPIESHNRILELSSAPNCDFAALKRHLIVGIRKTHRYVPNAKVSDWLVPFTSSGCRAMCLYCYLVCHYNKCAYLRLFVNREEMMARLLRADEQAPIPQTFEIGSNSDLVLENVVTSNLERVITELGQKGRGSLTFPTKFDMVAPLLELAHGGKTIFRMSVNPEEIVRGVEFGASPLGDRIRAVNEMSGAGYPVGILIAPVILLPGWEAMYARLLERLSAELSPIIRREGFLEVILMTYSYVQDAINSDAFPHAVPIFRRELMVGRGQGKYCYRAEVRAHAEEVLRRLTHEWLPEMKILYVV